jgi:hypothetical protein
MNLVRCANENDMLTYILTIRTFVVHASSYFVKHGIEKFDE